MNNNPQNDANQLKIELSPEVVEGVYSNLAVLTHSSAEFIFDFVRVLPGTNKAPVKSRVVMAPEHAKRLLFALQNNIAKYESTFGKIHGRRISRPQHGAWHVPDLSAFLGHSANGFSEGKKYVPCILKYV